MQYLPENDPTSDLIYGHCKQFPDDFPGLCVFTFPTTALERGEKGPLCRDVTACCSVRASGLISPLQKPWEEILALSVGQTKVKLVKPTGAKQETAMGAKNIPTSWFRWD